MDGAAALARGRMRTLKLNDFDASFQPHSFTEEALLRVLAANAKEMKELTYMRAGNITHTVAEVKALLAAAPALQRLTVCVEVDDTADAHALLRRKRPYAALHMLHCWALGQLVRTADGVIGFAADVAACESLRSFSLDSANLEAPAALEALVDAVLTRQLRILKLHSCKFAPAVALPQLARLLTDSRTALRELSIENSPTLFANAKEADIEALCDALSRSKIVWLKMKGTVREPALVAVLLRRALAAWPKGSPAAEVIVE